MEEGFALVTIKIEPEEWNDSGSDFQDEVPDSEETGSNSSHHRAAELVVKESWERPDVVGVCAKEESALDNHDLSDSCEIWETSEVNQPCTRNSSTASAQSIETMTSDMMDEGDDLNKDPSGGSSVDSDVRAEKNCHGNFVPHKEHPEEETSGKTFSESSAYDSGQRGHSHFLGIRSHEEGSPVKSPDICKIRKTSTPVEGHPDSELKPSAKSEDNGKDMDDYTYQCEMCSETFCHIGQLNTHRDSHEGGSHPSEIEPTLHSGNTCSANSEMNFLQSGCESENKSGGDSPSDAEEYVINIQYKGERSQDTSTGLDSVSTDSDKSMKLMPESGSRLVDPFQYGGPDEAVKESSLLPHTNGKPFECDICSKGFTTKYNLDRHERMHSGENKFLCHICSKVFTRNTYLSTHLMTVHRGVKPFQCNVCHKDFTSGRGLSCHERVHFANMPLECEVCGKVFKKKRGLSKHRKVHIRHRQFKCDTCKKSFRNDVSLSNHMRKHSGEPAFWCDVCHKGFKNAGRLKRHKMVHSDRKPFKCDICHKGFRQKVNLSIHERTHTGEKPYKCDVCPKAFRSASSLGVHRVVHMEHRSFKCEVCQKAFKSRRALSVHNTTHIEEKPFECDLCHKTFLTPRLLAEHKTSHSEERPFECDLCHKTYKTHKNLLYHKVVHSQRAKFECDVCHKFFLRRNDMSLHMRTHTKEKPYKCDTCNRSFTQNSILTCHKRTHTGERPFECDVCHAFFSRRDTLSKHKASMHRVAIKFSTKKKFDQNLSR